MTVKFLDPIRINMPVEIGPFTFLKSRSQGSGAVDLTSDFVAVSVSCILKQQHAVYATLAGDFVTAASGIVHVASHVFLGVSQIGFWQYQFYALDSGGNKIWGEPVQFEVVKNEVDADLDEVLPR